MVSTEMIKRGWITGRGTTSCYLCRLAVAVMFSCLTPAASSLQKTGSKTATMPDVSTATVQVPEGSAKPGSPVVQSEASKAVPEDEGEGAGKGKTEGGEEGKEVAEGAAAEGAEGAESAMKTIQRMTLPRGESNPEELNARPDENGMIVFSFREQAWPDLLQWLAEVSGMSLDWQELPGDSLNIATTRPYSLVEARDLFNRHLLMRGFTILEFEGMLQVARVSGINRALVPRVEPAELGTLPPNRFVRTTFVLDSLLAEIVLPELQSVLSGNGTMSALNVTNRLEVMDSAANLHEVHRIITAEQSGAANMAREFPLIYVRASAAHEQLEVFLGIKARPVEGRSAEEINLMMQQQMAEKQAEQAAETAAAQQAAAEGKAVAPKRSRSIHIVANQIQNSLIVDAPPDKMALIESFLKRIDVPAGKSPVSAIATRMKVYRLSTLSPEKLKSVLSDSGELEPATRIEIDENSNALIVNGSIADHYTISQLIERLDGSAREFHVVPLRRLRADEVAETVKFLMGVQEEKSDNENRFSYYYGYGYGEEKKESDDKFRVGANVRDNQLLFWANEMERNEIEKLLVKLGEAPSGATNPSRVRLIQGNRSPEMLEYLKRLQKEWQDLEGIRLEIPGDSEFRQEILRDAGQDAGDESGLNPDRKNLPPPVESTGDGSDGGEPLATGDRLPETAPAAGSPERFTSTIGRNQEDDPGGVNRDRGIRISLDQRGNLILSSGDPAALDRLERFMEQLKPPRQLFDTFHVKHVQASWIRLNLTSYFKDRKPEEKRDPFLDYFFFPLSPGNDNPRAGLDSRPPLSFLSDNDTGTIIVQGADDVDRQTIAQLIRLWDVPVREKESSVRRTRLISIRFGKAENIVETVKEVYRDLLSATDSSFQEKKDENDEGNSNAPPPRPLNFGGTLAMAAHAATNSIIITSSGKNSEELLEMANQLIEMLDEAEKPAGVLEVVQIDTGSRLRAKSIQMLMNRLLQTSGTLMDSTEVQNQAEATGQPASQAEQPGATEQQRQQKQPELPNKKQAPEGNRILNLGG